jgi:hypothetical protein
MKKTILLASIITLSLLNCQNKSNTNKIELIAKQEICNDTIITKTGLDLIDIKFKKPIKEFLFGSGLCVPKNEWVTNLDYEEYFFPKDKKINLMLAGNEIDVKKDSATIFYFKDSNKIWCYELELFNRVDNTKIVTDITKNIGNKPVVFEKKISTKERPLFVDPNTGEHYTDHIEIISQAWEDNTNKITYFFYEVNNFTKKEKVLKIFVLDKASPKYKEWISYRFLDWIYKEN